MSYVCGWRRLPASVWLMALLGVAGAASGAVAVHAQRDPRPSMRWGYSVAPGAASSPIPLTARETELRLPPDFPWECDVSAVSEGDRGEERTLSCRRDAAEVRVRAHCLRRWPVPLQGEALELNGVYHDGQQQRIVVALRCQGAG